jgi:CRISPR-associated endonuclease Cas1
MTAPETVYHSAKTFKSVPRHGVLTLVGYGIRIAVQRGYLIVHDGVGNGRCQYRLPKIGHRLKRVVVVGSDGFVTLASLKWLRDQDITFALLERNGKVLSVVGPAGSSDAKLRRAQGDAINNGVGLEICRKLISAKIQGQEHVLRERLNRQSAADVVARFRDKLGSSESFDAIRSLEASAAACYFREWRDLPVSWPKADLQKIPDRWRFVGGRQSPLTGGPRLAVTPAHAILNYCFALLEAESRLALSALGLDPGLGAGLHSDTADRSSLAFDVLEPVRPQVEAWLLDWVASKPLSRVDFFETATGNCRLMSSICTKLSETASVWRKLVAPWAQYLARTLSAGAKSGRTCNSVPVTRLTQRTEAKGKVWIATVQLPKMDHLCRGCGKAIMNESTHCADCAVDAATKRLVSAASLGRVAARSAEARAKHGATRRRHATACSEWDASTQPAWLTSEVFSQQIQPLLGNIRTSAIRSRIGVSRWYAGRIRQGYRPHPRHWLTLAQLVGVRQPNPAKAL